jgi:restriction system protein
MLGRNGEFEAEALDSGRLTIGFQMNEDLSGIKDRDGFIPLLMAAFPDSKPKRLSNFAAQLNQFVNGMQDGDLVVCPIKTSSTVAIGRVVGSYAPHPQSGKPTRTVEWLRTELPRSTFKQDMLYSFGAFNTVCEVRRNNALSRVEAVLKTGTDPGHGTTPDLPASASSATSADATDDANDLVDLGQIARDQIEQRLSSVFTGHDLTNVVAAILRAQGMRVRVSPPGADGGIDLVAGSGPLGLESPRIVAQVKSGEYVIQDPDLKSLIGNIHETKADYGLLVSWNGFTSPVRKRVNEMYFQVRLWDRQEIIDNLFAAYDRLPEEITAELPLKRVWMLVPEDGGDE